MKPGDIEATFFGTEEQTPAVAMEVGSDGAPHEAKRPLPPSESGRLVWVMAAGLVVGGLGTALYLFTSDLRGNGAGVVEQAIEDAGATQVAEDATPDAGEEELVLAPEVEVDAGPATVAVAPVPPVKDAGNAAVVAVEPVAVKDAGAVAVVIPAVKDAGSAVAVIAPAAVDAGAAKGRRRGRTGCRNGESRSGSGRVGRLRRAHL